jgi:glycosyltransferase involved in cell wall biosynthesis
LKDITNTSENRTDYSGNSIIVIVNRYPPLTSIYRYSTDLARGLGENGLIINLLFGKDGWDREHAGRDFSGKCRSFPMFNHFALNACFRDAAVFIRTLSRKYAKVTMHYSNQFSGVFKIAESERIVSILDSPFDPSIESFEKKYYMHWLYRKLSKEEQVIAETHILAEELKVFGFDGNIEVIPLAYSPAFYPIGLDKKLLRKKLGLPMDKKLVLSVSSTDKRKNLAMVRKAMLSLGDDFMLVRVGPSLGYGTTFSNVNDETLNEIYNACDVLLFPSLYEGFGLPIVESFAAGLPVVTSRIPTIEEVAGDAAVLINPLDLSDVISGIEEAVERSSSLVESGIKRAKNFTLEVFNKRMTDYYRRIGSL